MSRSIGFFGQNYIVSGTSYDPDAEAFFSAAGITDETQKSAVNQLVLDHKTAGTWELMLAIYPFVGGSSTTHKYNLKNPQDTDAAFRLTFSGGWTHSTTGAYPNGINGYANTHLNPSTANVDGITIQPGSASHHVYARQVDPQRSQGPNHGGYASGANSLMLLGWLTGPGFSFDSRLVTTNTDTPTTPVPLGKGNLLNYKTSNVVRARTDDSSSELSVSKTNAASSPNMLYLIGARYTGATPPTITANSWVNQELAYFSIGGGISGTQGAALITAVNDFQTTLGRTYSTT